MTRVDDLVTDLKLLISEHYVLGMQIEENTRLKAEIENIKAEVAEYLQEEGFGCEYRNAVMQIIDKHTSGKESS